MYHHTRSCWELEHFGKFLKIKFPCRFNTPVYLSKDFWRVSCDPTSNSSVITTLWARRSLKHLKPHPRCNTFSHAITVVASVTFVGVSLTCSNSLICLLDVDLLQSASADRCYSFRCSASKVLGDGFGGPSIMFVPGWVYFGSPLEGQLRVFIIQQTYTVLVNPEQTCVTWNDHRCHSNGGRGHILYMIW